MPKLYLAKLNLNSDIFNVYDNRLNLSDVLQDLYDSIDREKNVYDNSYSTKYTNSDGYTKHYKKISQYSFAQIEKVNESGRKLIIGKIVREYTKPSEKENNNGTVETYLNNESIAIRFFFDIEKELIAFCERQSFGYNQFTSSFTNLINMSSPKYKYEVFLQKDQGRLEEKLSELKEIKKIRAVLIPPNPNENNIKILRERCITTNSNKLSLEYESKDSLIMESPEMEGIKEYVANGYGDMMAMGINDAGHIQRVNSSIDAAYSSEIAENLNPEEFEKESKNLIIRFEEYRDIKENERRN